MVDAPKAVELAQDSLGKLVPKFASLAPHVEEVSRSDADKVWVITFRADNPDPREEKQGAVEVFFPYLEKIVRIRMDSGDLLSIQNRSYE